MKPRSKYALAAGALLVATTQVAAVQIPQPAPTPSKSITIGPSISGATPSIVHLFRPPNNPAWPQGTTVTLTGARLDLLTGARVELRGTKTAFQVSLLPSTDPTRRGVSVTIPASGPPAAEVQSLPTCVPMDLVLTWGRSGGITGSGGSLRAPVVLRRLEYPQECQNVPLPGSGYVTGTITWGYTTLQQPGHQRPAPSLTGVVVTVTPRGHPSGTTSLNASGVYLISVAVGYGHGNVTVSNLPTGCTPPNPVSYNGLIANNTVTAPGMRLNC